MKRFLLSVAMVLPMLAFVACGGDDDSDAPGQGGGGETQMNDGNGPIEEPLFAFYESPASLKGMEKRKLHEENLVDGSGVVTFYGATSAQYIGYNILDGKIFGGVSIYDLKNKDRLEDFLRDKYRLVEEGTNEHGGLLFETQDRLVTVGFEPTLASVQVAYLRQFTREQEKAKWAYPVLDWSKTRDEVKALEKRAFVKSQESVLTFESAEYMGTVAYMFSPVSIASISLLGVQVTDVPSLHYEAVAGQLAADGYVEIAKDPLGIYEHRFVHAGNQVQVDIDLYNRLSFNMSFHRYQGGDSQDVEE